MNEAMASSHKPILEPSRSSRTGAGEPKLSGSGFYLILLRQHLQRRAKWFLASPVVRKPHVRCHRIVTEPTPSRNNGV
jgi:hypothetical protein